MSDLKIVLPSKPKIVKEEGNTGLYEVDGLYPGYGHTLGNSLRRIILSSLSGVAPVGLKIDGVDHEFTVIDGVKEDVIQIILNLKKVRFQILSGEAVTVNLKVKGPKIVTAGDIELPGQVKVLNPEEYIAEISDKSVLDMEISLQVGLGYVPKESIHKEKVSIGEIALDASFTPIRRVNYEVENMRVGNRTDFNRLRLFIETNGTISPRESLDQSIKLMIEQLRSIVGFEETIVEKEVEIEEKPVKKVEKKEEKIDKEILKTRIEGVEDLSSRTVNALTSANIRTIGGLVRKNEEDLLDIDGLGSKGINEIKKALLSLGIELK